MSTTSTPLLPQQRPLAEVVDIVSGFGFPKELQGKPKGDLPFFKVGDISIAWNSGQKNLTQAQHYLDQAEASSIRAKAFPKGTVVFAKIGEAIRLNRRAILGQPSIVDNNVMGLIPKEEIVDPTYLFYWSLMLRLGDISQATTVPSVRKSDVEQLSFPWLSLDQQKRIVAEIEKHTSRLDEAVANLKRVKANLKRYKAAVLKAAVEGRLVETDAELARREGRSYETGEQLLQRILETHRSQWQGKGKYKEPAAPDTTDLPELPEGWVWVSLRSLGNVIGGLTKNPKRATLKKKLPYLRVANVYANELRLDEIEEIGVDDSELEKLLVHKGDLLIVEGNGSPDQIGRLAIWNGSISPCVHQNHLIKARLHWACAPDWVMSWLMSPDGRDHVRNVASSTSGLYTLSVGKVSGLPIPLPPEAEQHRIVAEVDCRLSLVRETEAQVDANLLRAERLRQSLLSRAFTGGLCPVHERMEAAA
ncbi:restriction endonuclease subunit S [Methylococcus mesophilus]|uniref:restriction endonuclease subunit S n=1 Tax=Methylococcus mesophilus TaxID=2993564 RepID=UPI00224A87D4|nr:restriction endonuclease subunit S [Methylococcus mesophilus]UZR30947.1 restriction endonuclease subunit S [Methylococcus mesophilus]